MLEQKTFDQELEQVLLDLGIPPCPRILLDLASEARKDEPDLHKIEKLISTDVGLSAGLIKTINSPFYGLRTKVHSIMQAIHMLGLSHLWLMVMGMVLRDTLKGMNNVEMGRFWDASAKVAIISSYIACRSIYLRPVPGLRHFHNVEHLPILQRDTEQCQQLGGQEIYRHRRGCTYHQSCTGRLSVIKKLGIAGKHDSGYTLSSRA
jgi:hypothetical protein